MIKYENECVGCPPEIGCLGNACSKKDVPHFYCDSCGDETDIYASEWGELCADCLLDHFDRVDDVVCSTKGDDVYGGF